MSKESHFNANVKKHTVMLNNYIEIRYSGLQKAWDPDASSRDSYSHDAEYYDLVFLFTSYSHDVE